MRVLFALYLAAAGLHAQIVQQVAAVDGGAQASTLATPTFSPGAGGYGSTQTVTVTIPGGSTGCYTTDSSTPTATSPGTCSHGTTLSGTISVASSETLNAIATEVGSTNSSVGTAVYVIGGGFTPTGKTCYGAANSGTSQSCTWSANPAAGESIFCGVSSSNSSSTFTVTDSASNSYTSDHAQYQWSSNSYTTNAQVFHFSNLAGSISTTSLHGVASSAENVIACFSATGAAASSPLDAIGFVATPSGGLVTVSLATTQDGDGIFCFNEGSTSITPSTGTGTNTTFTAGTTVTGGAASISVFTEYGVQTSHNASSSFTATVTGAGSHEGMICAAYFN